MRREGGRGGRKEGARERERREMDISNNRR